MGRKDWIKVDEYNWEHKRLRRSINIKNTPWGWSVLGTGDMRPFKSRKQAKEHAMNYIFER